MSDVIKLLPDSVANQIAAGEVIQRPASVVKELVENAVDAGANEISIIIKDAGRSLVQVVDNGCGMSATDARLAFERHSTSKISQADDLFSLHTMGFRGEALASICAVSQVDVRTMRHGDSVGTRLTINGSKVESQVPEACAPGTNMMVKNLFFNIPARRKFLKKDSVEMSNIIHEFERLALVNPEVELTLIHNDITLHRLPAANLRQRIIDLFGKQLDSKLLPVETDTDLVRISGFIVRPEHCKKRGALQYLFVNGRNMRHPVFHKAIMQCYEGLIPADDLPTYFLDFTVDPASIDVNIHPTKNEIKFEQELAIRQILFAAVKETIGRFSAAPAIDFDTLTDRDRLDIPAPGSVKSDNATPRPASRTAYNPFAPSSTAGWEELYRSFTNARSEAMTAPSDPQQSLLNSLGDELAAEQPFEPSSTALIPIGLRYAAMADTQGMRIIDLRRAHIAVLYSEFLAALSTQNENAPASQRLIFPEQVDVGNALEPVMQELEPRLTQAGFDLAPLGGGVWAVNAVPAIVDSSNPGELVRTILEDFRTSLNPQSAQLNPIALGMARAAAFRANRRMTQAELQHLASQLMSLQMPGFTPNGKPTFTMLSENEISRML